MRQVINLSLPPEMSSVVTKEVKTGKYSSTSEFFRSLLRAWMEDKLLIEIEESRKEIKQGKGKVLKSLKDLR
jgi:putative addiction module CopG family antidote